ncbi:unnamed protein product [Schistosoma curassoni]|nr:unnamed protein product [Schistosoma curassoni]
MKRMNYAHVLPNFLKNVILVKLKEKKIIRVHVPLNLVMIKSPINQNNCQPYGGNSRLVNKKPPLRCPFCYEICNIA